MPTNKPSIVILGVYHMANNNRDLIKTNYDDHLSPQRLTEIDDVLALLEAYQPTHIAIEKNLDMQATINDDYRKFLAGAFELTANEIHLIGFQLAQRLGHDQVYCVDANHSSSDLKMGLGDVLQYAEQTNQSYITEHLLDTTLPEQIESWSNLSVRDHLLKLNDSSFNRNNHRWYVTLAAIGQQPEQHFGADWVGLYWYTRNLRIFSNLSHLACSKPDARVLMIVGAGHVKLLTEFVEDAHHLDLIPVQTYLESD